MGGRPPFLPLNSKVSTFQLGHVHCTQWARTCAQMPGGALGIQPFPSLLMEIEKYGVKITAPGNSRIRFFENHPRRAMDFVTSR